MRPGEVKQSISQDLDSQPFLADEEKNSEIDGFEFISSLKLNTPHQLAALVKQKKLTLIDLDSKAFADDNAGRLALFFQCLDSPLWISLSRNKITDKGIDYIASSLLVEKCQLKGLMVHANPFGIDGTRSLAKALRDNQSVAMLSFGGRNLTEEMLKEICDSLMINITVNHLCLYIPKMTIKMALLLNFLFKNNKSLISFKLKCYEFEKGAFEIFVKSFEGECFLQSLELRSRALVLDNHMYVLVQALSVNSSLQYLILDQNQLSAIHAASLKKLIANNKKLKSLSLKQNQLSDKAITVLSEALFNGASLQVLDLARNCLTGDYIGKFVRDALLKNCSLMVLALAGNGDVDQALADTISAIFYARNVFYQNRQRFKKAYQSSRTTIQGAFVETLGPYSLPKPLTDIVSGYFVQIDDSDKSLIDLIKMQAISGYSFHPKLKKINIYEDEISSEKQQISLIGLAKILLAISILFGEIKNKNDKREDVINEINQLLHSENERLALLELTTSSSSDGWNPERLVQLKKLLADLQIPIKVREFSPPEQDVTPLAEAKLDKGIYTASVSFNSWVLVGEHLGAPHDVSDMDNVGSDILHFYSSPISMRKSGSTSCSDASSPDIELMSLRQNSSPSPLP